jgi:hypothetical protein
MGTKNKTTETSNQTQTAAPPSWALPQMQAIAGGIMSGLGTIQGLPAYTGDFVAQPGAISQSAPQAYLDAAAMARSLVDPAQAASCRACNPAGSKAVPTAVLVLSRRSPDRLCVTSIRRQAISPPQ